MQPHKKRQRKRARWSPTKFFDKGAPDEDSFAIDPAPINHPRERKRETENPKAEKHSKPGRTCAGSR